MSSQTSPAKLPEPFFEIQELTKNNYPGRKHRSVDQKVLNNLLRDFEKGNGSIYENAKTELLKNIPLEAVDPLWKMKNKFSFPTEKVEDVYIILGEIGTDQVAKLLSEKSLFFGDEAFYAMIALSKLNSPLTIELLGSMANLSLNFPADIMAINILKNINKPEAITALVNKSNFVFTESVEDDPNEEGFIERYRRIKRGKETRITDNLAVGVLFAGIKGFAQYYKNKAAKVQCSGFLTAPFLPLDTMLADQTDILRSFHSHRYRMNAVLSLCERWGLSYLDNCWAASQTPKKESDAYFLTGCYLNKGLDPAPVETYVNRVVSSKLNTNELQMKAIFLVDALLHGEEESLKAKYQSQIQGLIDHKETIVANSTAASVFYADYRPLIPKILLECSKPELIPAIVFSARIANNPDSVRFLVNNPQFQDEVRKWETFYATVSADYEEYINKLETENPDVEQATNQGEKQQVTLESIHPAHQDQANYASQQSPATPQLSANTKIKNNSKLYFILGGLVLFAGCGCLGLIFLAML